MKKILFAGLFMLGISTMSFSQATDSTHHHGAHHGKKMVKELNLTQDQKDKLKASNKELKAKKDQIKNDKTLTADQKKEQLKGLKAEQKKEFTSVLTPEQKQKMADAKAKHKKPVTNKNPSSPNNKAAMKAYLNIAPVLQSW